MWETYQSKATGMAMLAWMNGAVIEETTNNDLYMALNAGFEAIAATA